MTDWTATEWATVLAAGFAAVAAISAAVATGLQLVALRRARRPALSGAILELNPSGLHELEVTNAGPGLAVQVVCLVVDGDVKHGGVFGRGHLHAGEHATRQLGRLPLAQEPVPAIWSCRDVDQNEHTWSNDGRYKRVSRRRVMRRRRSTIGDTFRQMYPDVPIP